MVCWDILVVVLVIVLLMGVVLLELMPKHRLPRECIGR
jgi:hypothetical protein